MKTLPYEKGELLVVFTYCVSIPHFGDRGIVSLMEIMTRTISKISQTINQLPPAQNSKYFMQ